MLKIFVEYRAIRDLKESKGFKENRVLKEK